MNPFDALRQLERLAFDEGPEEIHEAEFVGRAMFLLTTACSVVQAELDRRTRTDLNFMYTGRVESRLNEARDLVGKLAHIKPLLEVYEEQLTDPALNHTTAFLKMQGWVRMVDKIAPVYDNLMQTEFYFSRSWG